MANIISSSRILISLLLIIFPSFSIPFYILYSLSGTSDILDGYVARKTNTESKLGERIDSIADFIFIIVCLIKILPVINIPFIVIIFIISIFIIRITNIILGFVYFKKLTMLHSILNKITGLLLFISVYFIKLIPILIISIPLCLIAFISSMNESYLIIKKKREEANENRNK